MTAPRANDPIATLSRIGDADAANRWRPDFHAELLELILDTDPAEGTEPVETSTAGLARPARHPRRRSAGRAPAHRWTARRPLLLAGTGAATVVALVLIVPGLTSHGSGGSSGVADAAILHGAEAAIADRPGTVVVMKMAMHVSGGKLTEAERKASDFVLTVTELTPQGGGKPTSLTTSQTFYKPGVQLVQSGHSQEIFDPFRNVIYRTVLPGSSSPNFVNPEKSIAKQLREHRLQVVGDVTLDGESAIELKSTDGKALYYVKPGSYQPLRVVRNMGKWGTATYDFTRFEVLPATAANARLVNLAALHPGARTVSGAAAYLAAQNRLGTTSTTTSLGSITTSGKTVTLTATTSTR